MVHLSSSLTLIWGIAAEEAVSSRHQYIEKEHLFVALCRILDLLHAEKRKQIAVQMDDLTPELLRLEKPFREAGVDRVKLRRRVRGLLQDGGFAPDANVIHRSERCKEYFEVAAKLAGEEKAAEVRSNEFWTVKLPGRRGYGYDGGGKRIKGLRSS